jgi:putative flippase GtrA
VLASRLGKFGVVGILGAGTYYLVLWTLVESLKVQVLIATSAAFLVVVLQNYAFHSAWTFRSTGPRCAALPRFAAMSVAGFCLNWSVMFVGVRGLGFYYLLVQAVAIAMVVAWNYALSALWVFRGD